MIVKVQIYRDNNSGPLISLQGSTKTILNWQATPGMELTGHDGELLVGFTFVPYDVSNTQLIVEDVAEIKKQHPVANFDIEREVDLK